MSKRKSTGKAQRFRIFSRDGFTCRYCGRQSDVVPLHVDHVVPVCKGGSSEDDNLITSCQDCNLGKAGNMPTHSAPTEADRLRLAQERNEQIEAARAANEASQARTILRQEVCNYFCNARGTSEMDMGTLTTLVLYVNQHGPDLVFQWIDSAVRTISPWKRDDFFGRYVSGCRRQHLMQENPHA